MYGLSEWTIHPIVTQMEDRWVLGLREMRDPLSHYVPLDLPAKPYFLTIFSSPAVPSPLFIALSSTRIMKIIRDHRIRRLSHIL